MSWLYNLIQHLAEMYETDITDEEFIKKVLWETGMDRMCYDAIMFQPEREEKGIEIKSDIWEWIVTEEEE